MRVKEIGDILILSHIYRKIKAPSHKLRAAQNNIQAIVTMNPLIRTPFQLKNMCIQQDNQLRTYKVFYDTYQNLD